MTVTSSREATAPVDDALYQNSLATLNSLEAPAVFTPGDNDWTDCDRPNNGGYDSLERLNYERTSSSTTPYTLGSAPLPPAGPAAAPYVENRRWTLDGVTYATLNVQGSCNNLCDTAPDPGRVPLATRRTSSGCSRRSRRRRRGVSRGDADHPGRSGFDQRTPRARRCGSEDAGPDGRPADGYQEFLVGAADEMVASEASCVRPRRLALLPDGQAASGFSGPHASRTSRASKRSATTRRTATTTCSGSR